MYSNGKKMLAEYSRTSAREFRAMTSYDKAAKGASCAGDMASAIKKFSAGDTQSVVSGCLDLFNGVANFLPPPASIVSGTLVSVANIFLGGKSGFCSRSSKVRQIDSISKQVGHKVEGIKKIICSRMDFP